MRDEVETAIAEVVRPLVEADGGGIELVAVEDEIVTVRLLRACGGCPGASYTKAAVIEPVLEKALGRPVRVRLQRAASMPGEPSPAAEDDARSG